MFSLDRVPQAIQCGKRFEDLELPGRAKAGNIEGVVPFPFFDATPYQGRQILWMDVVPEGIVGSRHEIPTLQDAGHDLAHHVFRIKIDVPAEISENP